jgi:signal transduction histidine kinase
LGVCSARSLAPLLDGAEHAARTLSHARLSDDQLAILDSVSAACAVPGRATGPIELSARQDAFADWLERLHLDSSGADTLASSGVEIADLDRLAATLPPAVLGAAITSVANGRTVRALAAEVAAAAGRIHGLVEAVKGFTFMDRETVPGEVDIARGLADTLTVLQNKSRRLSVEVRLDAAPDLPRVNGFGSEINQVWEKLVDNAIDAAGTGGHVAVRATSRADRLVVEVTDDGPGILEANRARVFDPFFTTKPMGQGTGLGLHLARRVVLFHHGEIDFTSEPGRTTFRVRFPAANGSEVQA